MEMPNFKELERMFTQNEAGVSYASGMHPNRYFYKYYFWVFWRKSTVEGSAFLEKEYRLNIAAAMALMGKLRERGEPYMLYNDKIPRRDPLRCPFDPDSPQWWNSEWACRYEDDPDPEWKGFK